MQYSESDIIRLSKNLDDIFCSYGSIEKKIHITWSNKEIICKDYNIIKNGILQLKNLNPDYEFNIYDDNDVDNYLINKLSNDDYELIKNKKMVEKTDLWRLLIIYNEGGIYQDIDRFCNIPLSKIIDEKIKCVIPMFRDTDFSQDIIICCSKNIFHKKAIELNLERRRNNPNSDILYLGPNTYFNAITEIILGSQIDRNPKDKQILIVLRDIINNSKYLKTFREEPLYFTLLYRGPEIYFDKQKMYENENVIHWQT
jgi:hypothetical protein